MFKNLIKSLSKMNYSVALIDGDYVVTEESTGKHYMSFPIGAKNKENILTNLYLQLCSKKQAI